MSHTTLLMILYSYVPTIHETSLQLAPPRPLHTTRNTGDTAAHLPQWGGCKDDSGKVRKFVQKLLLGEKTEREGEGSGGLFRIRYVVTCLLIILAM